jgi:hypothetical protein
MHCGSIVVGSSQYEVRTTMRLLLAQY